MSEDEREDRAFEGRLAVLTYTVIGLGWLVASHGTASVVTVAGVLAVVGLFHGLLVFAEGAARGA